MRDRGSRRSPLNRFSGPRASSCIPSTVLKRSGARYTASNANMILTSTRSDTQKSRVPNEFDTIACTLSWRPHTPLRGHPRPGSAAPASLPRLQPPTARGITLTPVHNHGNSSHCTPTDVHEPLLQQHDHGAAAAIMRLAVRRRAHGGTPTARPPRHAIVAARLRRARPQ